MKMLFVIPRSKDMFGDEVGTKAIADHPHVGVAYLVAVLKRELPKIKIKIYDEQLEGSKRSIKKTINYFAPDVIGITTFSYNYQYFYDLVAKLKKFTKIPILLGGPHVSAVGKMVLSETKADFAIKGEGEIHEMSLPDESFRGESLRIWSRRIDDE